MKSNLDMLIDEAQREVDSLKQELDRCVLNHYFLEADSIHKALILSKNRLDHLRNIRNPNQNKIDSIKFQLDKSDGWLERFASKKNLDERLYERLKKRSIDKENALSKELKKLENEKPKPGIDEDVLLTVFEDVLFGETNRVVVDIVELEIELSLFKDGISLELRIMIKQKNRQFSKYNNAFDKLKTLGFSENGNSYTKKLDATSEIPSSILELYAIIFLEVFYVKGYRELKVYKIKSQT